MHINMIRLGTEYPATYVLKQHMCNSFLKAKRWSRWNDKMKKKKKKKRKTCCYCAIQKVPCTETIFGEKKIGKNFRGKRNNVSFVHFVEQVCFHVLVFWLVFTLIFSHVLQELFIFTSLLFGSWEQFADCILQGGKLLVLTYRSDRSCRCRKPRIFFSISIWLAISLRSQRAMSQWLWQKRQFASILWQQF